MGRDDWYRRTTWTSEDAEAFFDRLNRSRGLESKAQYVRIQALDLEEAGLIEPASSLLGPHSRGVALEVRTCQHLRSERHLRGEERER